MRVPLHDRTCLLPSSALPPLLHQSRAAALQRLPALVPPPRRTRRAAPAAAATAAARRPAAGARRRSCHCCWLCSGPGLRPAAAAACSRLHEMHPMGHNCMFRVVGPRTRITYQCGIDQMHAGPVDYVFYDCSCGSNALPACVEA